MTLEKQTIARLYQLHARRMVGFFMRRTYDAEAAVDLVAETFAAALADREGFRGHSEEEVVAWLYGIARHQLSRWFRRGSVERRMLRRVGIERRDLTDPELERIEELAGLEDLRAKVAGRLEELPDAERDVLRLRVVEERGYEDVAADLGISEVAARARVSRALRSLAAWLESQPAPEASDA